MCEISKQLYVSNNLSNDAIQINNKFEQLKLMIKNCGADADTIEFQNKTKLYGLNQREIMPTAQASDIDSQCNVYEENVHKEMKFFNSIRNVIDLLTVVQKIVIDEQLGKWRNERILASKYGHQSDIKSSTHIDQIQIWFEQLLKLICKMQTLIKIVRNSENRQQFPNEIEEKINADIIEHLRKLVRSSLIVEEQPPQIIEENTK